MFLCSLILALNLMANADSLDKAIERAARAHNVSARRLRAIAHLESSSGKSVMLRKNKNGTYDLGPFQINSVHWSTTCKMYDVSSTEGNAMCAALLLRQAKRHESADPYWVGRYHSKTPSKKKSYAMKVIEILKKD